MKYFYPKRNIVFIILFMLSITISFGQVQLSENFDGTFTPNIPTSAITTPTDYVSSATGTWTLFQARRYTSSTYSSPNAIEIYRVNNGYVITPTLNSVGTITLFGLSSGPSQRTITIEKSVNDGAFQQVGTIIILGSASGWNQGSLIINEPSNNVRIKIVAYNATAGGDVRIDNVVITTSPSAPTINISVSSLPSFGNVVSGNSSSSAEYTVSGANLIDNINIVAPSGFQLSTDNISFFTSITLIRSSDSVPTTSVFVRFSPTSAVGTISGNINHTSTNAIARTILVNGVSLSSEPTIQSNLTFETITGNSITVNFSGGNGARRVLVARLENPVSWTPTDANTVSGVNSIFTSATDQGNGNRIVYDGSGNSVTISGLSQNTTYHFAVYEYNVGTGNSQNYLTTSPGTGNQTTLGVPTIFVVPTSLSFGNIDINTTSDEKTYSLSANALTPTSGIITVTAPSGYVVSTTSESGYSSSVLVPYSGGVLSSTTIFVRFIPTIAQGYVGNITNAGGGATTQNVSVSGNGLGPAEPNVFQAEDALLISSYALSQYSGYTGSGYVDMADKTGSAVEFTFRRSTASTDTVIIRFANGGSSRALTISLNDANIGTLNFASTSSWSNWSNVNTVIAFQAGINRLRFTLTTNASGPNLDKITLRGQTATPVYKLTLAKSGAGTVTALPASTDSFYDSGTQVTLTADPAPANMLYRWTGTDQSRNNPFNITMNTHKTIVGVMASVTGMPNLPYQTSPRGFASVGALGYPNGTTGGSGSPHVVYVTTYADLVSVLLRRLDANRTLNMPPLTIYIIGTLNGSGMVDVKDANDISIIGVGVDATLSGFGLNIVRSYNIIVRNLKIQNSPDDGISLDADDNIANGHHIWIDHCTFTNCYDGALDITHGIPYVTVSWNYFFNHDKTSLVGHSDSQTSDTTIKVTYHHNYFDGTGQRHPRVRFGKVHVFNNYFRNVSMYGVSSNREADVLVEGNYFLNVPVPYESLRVGTSYPGDLVARNNILTGTTGAGSTRGTAFEPSIFYSYTMDAPSIIPDLVQLYAGSGKYDFSGDGDGQLPVQLAFFVANVIGGNSVKLEWETISEINNYGFNIQRLNTSTNEYEAIGFVAGAGSTTETQSYSFTDYIVQGTEITYRLEQIDNDGLRSYSNPVVVMLNPNDVGNQSVPAVFALHQNYPNPFNPTTKIKFSVDKTVRTTLVIFDLLGQKVLTLFDDVAEAGRFYEVKLNVSAVGGLTSGVYFYKLQGGQKNLIKKLILLK